MKNETARREIESLDYYLQNHTNDYSEESHMAMMMAIKALEQQPCEDAVSREELLARIDEERKHLLDIKMDGAEHILVHHARRIIEDMPSVTPQKKVGRWIAIERSIYQCSVCGILIYNKQGNYCPNCGADMRGDADERTDEPV